MAIDSRKIMVVEDEHIFARDLIGQLINLGYEICCHVTSGEEAVSFVENEIPDCILMDVRLAGRISGIEAAEEIGKNCDIPIIFLTAFTDKNTVTQAKKTDPYGYLVKPITIEELSVSLELAFHRAAKDREKREYLQKMEESIRKSLETSSGKSLDGLLSICSYCKNIRDDEGSWHKLERYLQDQLSINFSHGICPDCAIEEHPELFLKIE